MNKNPDTYQVPAESYSAEIKVKGSRFLATVVAVASVKDAEQRYAEIAKKYYDATHNCYAWRVAADTFRFSDDGEPSGTAGRPILQAIEGSELLEILVVVTRYFGGTKLGTGGLLRAYGDAAALALKDVPRKTKIRVEQIALRFDYALEKTVRHLLDNFGGRIAASDYSAGVKMEVLVPQSRIDDFKDQLLEMTHSAVELE